MKHNSGEIPGSNNTESAVTRDRALLAIIFLLALFLRLFRVELDGFSNLYYAATVQSMLASWHNLLFASFDLAGFVSVDKSPLGFWIQTLSAWIFGFRGWALILPQALAGALSSPVIYMLVRRVFGGNAGLLAALILAVTPVSVATHRSNTPDGLLLLILLLAALLATKAAESGQMRWLLGSAALVGLGFNIKMLQAYLIVPALFLFMPVNLPLLKRVGQLSLAMLVMFTLSFTWPLAVELSPASARPYVGSTVTNNVFELVAVHNGVRRLGPIVSWFGIREKDPGPGTVAASLPGFSQGSAPLQNEINDDQWPDGGFREVGDPGPLRLFNRQLAGQVSWLLPLALLALVSGVAGTRWKQPPGRAVFFFSLWGGWLILTIFFFSYGGLIHRYYLDMLAPPIAALSSAGLVTWTRDLLAGRRLGWLLPTAVTLTAAFAYFFLGYYPQFRWLAWSVLVIGILTALALLLLTARLRAGQALLLSLPALLLVPLIWSTTPMWRGGDVILPFAGPELVEWGGERGVMNYYQALTDFLSEQHSGEAFLAATQNAVVAAPLQLITGRAVMAMGGFTGTDPILTVPRLSQYIADGEVRFILVYQQDVKTLRQGIWIAENCKVVQFNSIPEGMVLYDCRSPH